MGLLSNFVGSNCTNTSYTNDESKVVGTNRMETGKLERLGEEFELLYHEATGSRVPGYTQRPHGGASTGYGMHCVANQSQGPQYKCAGGNPPSELITLLCESRAFTYHPRCHAEDGNKDLDKFDLLDRLIKQNESLTFFAPTAFPGLDATAVAKQGSTAVLLCRSGLPQPGWGDSAGLNGPPPASDP